MLRISILSLLGTRVVVAASEPARHPSIDSGDANPEAEVSGADPSQYVNVFVGTGANGNTFPGATVPFGMVQFSPMMDKPVKSRDFYSGYHKEESTRASTVLGFGLTALSGKDMKAGGDFIFLPGVAWGGNALGKTAKLSHESEQASPGYYKGTVQVPSNVRCDATVELTAGSRSGMLRLSFDSQVAGKLEHTLLVNLDSPEDKYQRGHLEQTGPTQLRATRSARSAHRCGVAHRAYAAIETNFEIKSLKQVSRGLWQITFEDPIQELTARIGLSYVDMEGALNNLRQDIGKSWDFDAVSNAAQDTWNSALARATVSGSTDVMRRYYTALYHSMLGPTLYSDADRRYRLGEQGVKVSGDFDFYSTFSLWDTYRAEHPLLNLLFPEMAPHFAKSLLAIEKHKGKLPKWVLYGEDTKCTVGYPAVNIISEAALKDLLRPQVDATVLAEASTAPDLERESFDATIRTSRLPEDGSSIDNLVAISAEDSISEGMSKALEYAWSDSCIAKFADRLGESKVKQHYVNRSHLYRTYFHEKRHMLLPRIQNMFIQLKDNRVDKESSRFYGEGSPLQYNFMVPHDIPGFIELLGSQAALEKRLDEFFGGEFEDLTPDSEFHDSAADRLGLNPKDSATGHLGGHIQSNEPGHHIPYMYNSAGVPWKTQETVDQVMAMYTADRSGLPGNDDVGQMSAWFVFSALGFYPVDPCSGKYAIGRPLVDHATLKLSHGDLNIDVNNQAPSHKYVSGMSWKGSPVSTTDLQHESIVHGGQLLFELSSLPSDFRGQSPRMPASVRRSVATPVALATTSFDSIGGDKQLRSEKRKEQVVTDAQQEAEEKRKERSDRLMRSEKHKGRGHILERDKEPAEDMQKE